MFSFRTAGESHGKALLVIVDGVPAGLSLSEDYIARDLQRRQGGYGRGKRQKIERDRAEIISGVRHGLTLGSPIGMMIENRDWTNWQEVMSSEPIDRELNTITRLRPGHADMAGSLKYHQSDVRNILERSSARETAARVAAGAIGRRFLEEFGVEIHSHTLSIGSVAADPPNLVDWAAVEASAVRCADEAAGGEMVAAIDAAKEAGDTVGGVFEVVANHVPIGLGSHVQWNRRLDGRIAQLFMSINAVKGVEIGPAFANAAAPGSEVHDIFEPWAGGETDAPNPGGAWARRSNRAGGLEGGMTNGQPIVVRGALKPISTLNKPLPSVDLMTGETVQAHYERSDICVVPAAGVIGEAMLAAVLADAVVEKFGGDHLSETLRNFGAYQTSDLT